MKPIELAAAVYQQEDCARSFREDLEAHLLNGFVYSTPDAFLMGRPVRRDANPEDIVNPWVNFTDPDCWHCYLFSGSLHHTMSMPPFKLPWVSYERKNRLRFYRWSDIERQCTRYQSSRSSLGCTHTSSIL
jgi:hypothetical protein